MSRIIDVVVATGQYVLTTSVVILAVVAAVVGFRFEKSKPNRRKR